MAEKKSGDRALKNVETLIHEEASRKNIPTAEFQSVMPEEKQKPVPVTYPRGGKGLEEEKEGRNRDLDPQLVWRGKDEKDWSDLVVNAPPLYIQEKVHPKVLIDDLVRRSAAGDADDPVRPLRRLQRRAGGECEDPSFYQHDANCDERA